MAENVNIEIRITSQVRDETQTFTFSQDFEREEEEIEVFRLKEWLREHLNVIHSDYLRNRFKRAEQKRVTPG